MINTHGLLGCPPVYLIYCILSTWWQSALYSCRCTALYCTVQHCTLHAVSVTPISWRTRPLQATTTAVNTTTTTAVSRTTSWGGSSGHSSSGGVIKDVRGWPEDCATTARQHQRYLWTLLAIRPANGVHQPRPHQHRHLCTFLCELRTSDIFIMWVSWEIWTDKKVDSHSSRYVSSLYVKIFGRMSWDELCVAYIAFYISLFLADLSRYVI